MLSGDSIFILQCLIISKKRKSQTKKLSHFHKAISCWIENSWSSGIMSNFRGQFFHVLVGRIFFRYLNIRNEPLLYLHFVSALFFPNQDFSRT